MKFAVGSQSERKLNTVRKVAREHVTEPFDVVGFPAKSGVPETPWDHETHDGARNRALHTKEVIIDANYYIGLESGLVERYGDTYEEAWCCVIDTDGNEYLGYSSGLLVPSFILDKMEELDLPHNKTMTILEKEHGLIDADTWGTYSGNQILREVSLEEALRNALIQAFANEKSFYKK